MQVLCKPKHEPTATLAPETDDKQPRCALPLGLSEANPVNKNRGLSQSGCVSGKQLCPVHDRSRGFGENGDDIIGSLAGFTDACRRMQNSRKRAQGKDAMDILFRLKPVDMSMFWRRHRGKSSAALSARAFKFNPQPLWPGTYALNSVDYSTGPSVTAFGRLV